MHGNRIAGLSLTVLTVFLLFLGTDFPVREAGADPSCARDAIDEYQKIGLSIRSRPWWGVRPLTDAAHIGDLCLAKWLLEQGVDLNAATNRGYTAFMAATWAGRLQMARFLLEKGADINAAPEYGFTPLMEAAQSGRQQTARFLLKHGAEVNAAEKGYTALMLAAQQGDLQMVRLLLEHGADVNATDIVGKTALDRVAAGHPEVVEEFRRAKRSTNQESGEAGPCRGSVPRNNPGKGPTRKQADSARDDRQLLNGSIAVERLHTCGCAYWSDVDDKNRTPLMEAAARGDLLTVKRLVSGGADLNDRWERSGTALMVAAEKGHAEVVEYLLSKGADVNGADDYRGSPLTSAACSAHPEIMRILIEHGANVNEARPLGCVGAKYEVPVLTVPFESAAAMGDVALVRLMLDKGASLPVLGRDALMVALRNGRTEVAKLLEERGVKVTLSDLAHLGLTKEILSRLAAGADVNEENESGETALMMAAEQGYLKLVKLLLDRGADLTAQGLPALSSAARRGRLNVVKFFVERGVDVSQEGRGPDLIGVVQNRHPDLLRYLLDHGADVNAHDSVGWTVLMEAANVDRMDMVELLLEHGADVSLTSKFGTTAIAVALDDEIGGGPTPRKPPNYPMAALLWKHAKHSSLEKPRDVQGFARPMHRRTILQELELLLDHGMDINARDRERRTPLMIAVQRGSMPLVKSILKRGADLNVTDQKGKTALDLAKENRSPVIAELLFRHASKPATKKQAR